MPKAWLVSFGFAFAHSSFAFPFGRSINQSFETSTTDALNLTKRHS
jgi:hypothetical protein